MSERRLPNKNHLPFRLGRPEDVAGYFQEFRGTGSILLMRVHILQPSQTFGIKCAYMMDVDRALEVLLTRCSEVK